MFGKRCDLDARTPIEGSQLAVSARPRRFTYYGFFCAETEHTRKLASAGTASAVHYRVRQSSQYGLMRDEMTSPDTLAYLFLLPPQEEMDEERD